MEYKKDTMNEQMKIKVLGLAGSPRRDGNTDRLLDAFLAGARNTGAETKALQISALQIAPCDDCDGCSLDGKCIVEDDYQEVSEQIIAADVVVLSTPLYFSGLPAQVKCLVDRSQCQWVRKYRLHTPLPVSHAGYCRRKGVLLAVAGDPRGNFEGIRRTVRYFFNVYEIDYVDGLLIRGVDGKGMIDVDMLQSAATLGEITSAKREHN